MSLTTALTRRAFARSAIAGALATQLPGLAWAQAFKPPKSVTMVCPYPAGGLGDATARTLAKGLGDLWKVPVIVDTKAGATGMIGAASVAKAPGDGTVLLCMLPEALSVAKALKTPMGFDITADLTPVALSVVSGCLLSVNAKSRFQTYQDLLQYAKANPGRLNFGVQGTGSAFHLAAEQWALAEGIKITTVPYKGGAPLMTDLLGGQLDAMFMATSLGLPYLRTEQLRALAIASRDRIEELRDVKTLKDFGVRDFEVPITLGVFAPGTTPPAIIQALNQDMRAVMDTAEAREWMKKSIVTSPDLTADAFRQRMAHEIAGFTDVAARANIKLN